MSKKPTAKKPEPQAASQKPEPPQEPDQINAIALAEITLAGHSKTRISGKVMSQTKHKTTLFSCVTVSNEEIMDTVPATDAGEVLRLSWMRGESVTKQQCAQARLYDKKANAKAQKHDPCKGRHPMDDCPL